MIPATRQHYDANVAAAQTMTRHRQHQTREADRLRSRGCSTIAVNRADPGTKRRTYLEENIAAATIFSTPWT